MPKHVSTFSNTAEHEKQMKVLAEEKAALDSDIEKIKQSLAQFQTKVRSVSVAAGTIQCFERPSGLTWL